jgi:hypothetical protein
VTSSGSGDAIAHGSGPADRAAAGVQVPPRSGGEGALRASEGDPHGGVERAARALPSHRLRRYPRPVLRPLRALPHRRRHARHQLPIHGRLRRSVPARSPLPSRDTCWVSGRSVDSWSGLICLSEECFF